MTLWKSPKITWFDHFSATHSKNQLYFFSWIIAAAYFLLECTRIRLFNWKITLVLKSLCKCCRNYPYYWSQLKLSIYLISIWVLSEKLFYIMTIECRKKFHSCRKLLTRAQRPFLVHNWINFHFYIRFCGKKSFGLCGTQQTTNERISFTWSNFMQ